jgi:hypothetical protein
MSDTSHPRPTPAPHEPTEGDGVSYRGIVWFVVVLTVTTLVCQGLVLLLLNFELTRDNASDVQRAPTAAPALTEAPPPNLISLDANMPQGEATNLARFRESEDVSLTTYGWVDKNAGTVRIPIDRAKALLLERGLPVRGATPPARAVKR